MSRQQVRSVPSLKDLCTKNVGENLGTIAKCYLNCDEINGYDSLELSPFDLIRKIKTSFFIHYLFVNGFLHFLASLLL